MKTVISGRLIEDPEIKTVTLADGNEVDVCNYQLWVSDPTAPTVEGKSGREFTRDVAFNCTAWGDNAKEVAALKKNSVLTGSYVMKYNEGKANYVVKRIDPENKLQKQLADLLNAYEDNIINDLSVPDLQPSFDKGMKKGKDTAPEKNKDMKKGKESDKSK